MSAANTRRLIKSEMRNAGWRRMRTHDRPAHGQSINVAHEWIERRLGTTEQFLIYGGEYYQDTDQVGLIDASDHIALKDAKAFHWWMPVYRPDTANTLNLYASQVFRRMGARVLGYGGVL